MTFRTRIFAGVFFASALAVAVATVLVERSLRSNATRDIERSLLTEARLASALLIHRPLSEPDDEANALGRLISSRVTFIDRDGRVIGDSAVDAGALSTLENHATREEVIEARQHGEGSAVRHSATTGIDTMYAAAAVTEGPVAVVRVALPLTVIEERVSSLRRRALVGLGAGTLAAALLTWIAATLLNRRIRAVAETAERYRAGDFSQPARDYGADEIGTVARVLDDTAREVGVRLREMERERAHMDAILSGMAEGVVLLDGSGRLALTNPAGREMLNVGAASRAHYLEVVRQPDVTSQLAQALGGVTPAAVEIDLGGRMRRTVVSTVVPVAPARGGGAVLVLSDITALRQADRMRRDFVANVSHELRTPLTAIRGYVETLQDGVDDPAQARHFLDVIERHALRMEHLVRDLLRLARLDAGQETLDRADCSVAALVDAVARDLESQVRARDQRIDTTIAAGAGRVTADAPKLQDALRNLVENASRYGPAGSVIEVAVRRDAGDLVMTVADRGPGIPEADLTRVFERFYRVDRSRAQDPGGTGLGLSIVRHLIELHGGRVTAANRPGGGAVLTIALPAPAA